MSALLSGRVVERAVASRGQSCPAIYRMVAAAIGRRPRRGGTLVDVGCGRGDLRNHVAHLIDKYAGADAVRYEDFPTDAQFFTIDLDAGRVPLPDASAEIVVAVETIEHLENPRALFRELRRLAKKGGLIIITTPNQLSLLSKLTLLVKNQFNAFLDAPGLYPAHITALLEGDLRRMANECGLVNTTIHYSNEGRIPGTSWHWPKGLRGRRFSDNLMLTAEVGLG